mgnify:CR=1 FL=1
MADITTESLKKLEVRTETFGPVCRIRVSYPDANINQAYDNFPALMDLVSLAFDRAQNSHRKTLRPVSFGSSANSNTEIRNAFVCFPF